MDWVETRDGLENAGLELNSFNRGLRNKNDISYRAYLWAERQSL